MPSLTHLRLALLLTATIAQAQTHLVEPPTPLLPTTQTLVPPTNLPTPPPEQPAILKEDGLQREESRSVLPTGYVTAYQFSDATGAFAAYTYLRQTGRPVPGLKAPFNTEFRKPTGDLVYLTGTTVVVARAPQPVLESLEPSLPKIFGRRALAPLLPTLLPTRGLDPATLRYALGPIGYQAMGGVLPPANLGWDKSLEVATANYHAGQLTVLMYPTPQLAGASGRLIQDDINHTGPATFGTIKMRRVGPMIGVTSGRLTDAQAIDLVTALKLNQEITFDKKMPLEFHAEVRKTYTLLQEISTFCGIAILASVVLGIFFGAGRAGIRLLQGKTAASDPEFLTINLRDQPKALFTKPQDPTP